MKNRSIMLAVTGMLLVFGGSLRAQEVDHGPMGVKTQPMKAEWRYRRDGGTNFTNEPPAGAPAKNREGVVPLEFRGSAVPSRSPPRFTTARSWAISALVTSRWPAERGSRPT